MKFKSRLDDLFEKLREEGKITTLSEEEIVKLNDAVNENMEKFRVDLRRKQQISIEDTKKIILNV